jgi:hippurate hydrolase
MKNGAGPTVLVRADMDALPVPEKTGLPYASRVYTKDDSGQDVPVMHACGHDSTWHL